MKVEAIPLDQIEVGERLREIDEDYARALAASIRETGQRLPAELRAAPAGQKLPLISGAHRYRAVQINAEEYGGKPVILAVKISANEARAELLQIDENLCRHELNALDRAVFIARRKELYDTENGIAPGRRKHSKNKQEDDVGQDGQNSRIATWAPRADEALAEKFGVSARQFRREEKRAGIIPDVRKRLAGTALARNGKQLDALAKVKPTEQDRVVTMLLAPEHPVATVAEALAKLHGTRKAAPKPKRDEAVMAAFVKLWESASPKVQDRIVTFLVRKGVAALPGGGK